MQADGSLPKIKTESTLGFLLLTKSKYMTNPLAYIRYKLHLGPTNSEQVFP